MEEMMTNSARKSILLKAAFWTGTEALTPEGTAMKDEWEDLDEIEFGEDWDDEFVGK